MLTEIIIKFITALEPGRIITYQTEVTIGIFNKAINGDVILIQETLI